MKKEINEKKIRTDKYKKILNNLLNIRVNDSCLFHQINNKNFYDVYKKFGKDFFQKIISSSAFNISLKENDLGFFLEEIREAKNKEEIIKIYNSYNNEIPDNISLKLSKELTEKKFKDIIEEISNEAEIERQKASYKWKLLYNKARSINEQNNLWPLHLGFVYITVKVENKSIQAPLFFKEVTIKIKNSNISLSSLGNIKMNEKLVHFLSTQGYLFDIDFDFSDISILNLYESIKKNWEQNFTIPKSLVGDVPNFKTDEIKKETIEFHPGVSLGFFEPSGSHLRKTMLKIIEDDILDSILDVEFDKNVYKNRIKKTMFKEKFGFYKIQHSNFSQDKAVVSSLNQNTIIWGPPGTGKSQTISNILTNILMFEKTALVVSQKKAALIVLKNRMEDLEIFCLFVLNDKEMNKKSFYKPIKDYLEFLENINEKSNQNHITILDENERKYLNELNEILNKEKYNTNLDLYLKFVENNEFDINKFNKILELKNDIKYNYEKSKNQKNINKYLFDSNNLKRKNFFQKYTKDIKNSSKIIKEDLFELDINLDYFVEKQNEISIEILKAIHNLSLFDSNKNSNNINDVKKLKIVIAQNIANKMRNLSPEMKKKYNKFALDARTGSLDINSFLIKHSEIIKMIYPIIITSPETDLHSWGREEFDYCLLDESSQIFLEKALPILYLSKIKILAGDDQQMQPSRWFASKNEGESEFGDIESILDYAKARGVYNVLLDKNYRSKYASLMSFNSKIFYESKLDVVDVNLSTKNEPIVVYNVDGFWDNSINREEIEKVMEILNEEFDKYEKIIILSFNAAQSQEFEKIIFQKYPKYEKAIFDEKLLLRNIENIQGDEADLIIMSVVYDKTTKLHSSYVAKSNGRYALNVAISRAKDKMIVVKSIYSDDVITKENSLEDVIVFKKWLKFLDLSSEEKKNYVTTKKIKNENESFEIKNEIISELKNKISEQINNLEEVEFIENYSIGTIKIDFIVLEKQSKKFIIGFLIDDFISSSRDFESFAIFKDKKSFFIMKKYPIIGISKLNLKKQSLKISKIINKYISKK